MRDIGSDEARKNLRDMLDEVQEDWEAAFRISRHGRPVAVVVSAVWYERTVMSARKAGEGPS
jgi:prevent-host-death family protein